MHMKVNKQNLLVSLLLVCLADNVLLTLITYFSGYPQYSLYFVISQLAYIPAWVMVLRRNWLSGYIWAAIAVNLLLFVFDTGILGNGREFILFIPVIISYYVFLPLHYKKQRLFAVLCSLIILSLTTFTSFTPKLKIEIYEALSNHINFVASANTFTSLLATVILLHHLIEKNNQITQNYKDINERLLESEFRLEFALNVSRDGIWDWDIQNNTVFFSDKWKQQLGYGEFEIENDFNAWLSILHPDDKAKALTELYAYVDGKTDQYSSLQRLRAKDGTYRWILDRGEIAKRDKEGKPLRMIGTHSDRTEKIESEKALKKTEQMLVSFNKNLTEGIYRSTPDKGLVYVNDAFAKLFQYADPGEILSLESADLYQFPEQRISLQNMIAVFHSFSNQEVLFKRRDGSTFWGLVSSTKTVDSEGNVYYDGAIRDISHIKEAESRLIDAKEKMEKALQSKNLFLSTISHEIRTPLHAISGLVQYLIQNKPRPDQQESIDTLLFTVKHLNALITNMINYATTGSESNQITIIEAFDLNKLLDAICNGFSKEAQEKNIEIKKCYDSKLDFGLMGDTTSLSQVINNLFTNALKFTEAGRITLAYEITRLQKSTVSVRFSVKDTGIGIESDKQHLIFESFTQADNSIKRKYGGTGLGLAICKKILKQLGSDIFVKSTPGSGSNFYFDLDFELTENKAVAHPRNAKNQKQQSNGDQSPDVLIVDDNPTNIFVLVQHLKLSGISYSSATSGEECLELMKRIRPKMVFLDIHMPGIDGIETCRYIKRQLSDTIVAGLTADTSPVIKHQALEAGMETIFYKPFNSSEILDYIRSIIELKQVQLTA